MQQRKFGQVHKFQPVTVHFNTKTNKLYCKNKAGRKHVYTNAQAKDLVTGGSLFNIQHHWQRFRGVAKTLKAMVLGNHGKKTKSAQDMDTNRKVGARLAQAAYSGKAPEGFEIHSKRKDGRMTIFKEKGKNRYTVGFRGTVPKKSDLWNDLKITAGKVPHRTKELLPEVEDFLKKNPKAIVNFSGHSLGAAVAVEARERLKHKYSNLKNAYAYALPASPFAVGEARKKYQNAVSDRKNIVTHVSGDPVSAGLEDFRVGNRVIISGKSKHLLKLSHHSISNMVVPRKKKDDDS